MSRLIFEDGNLIEDFRDSDRKVYGGDGAYLRDYTPEENAAADARAEAAQDEANAESIASKLVTVDFPAMQAILDTLNADINSNPASEIKDLARAVRRLTRKVERLLDGTD